MIVALMHIYSKDPIMICSDQNETADLLYEALNKHESIASTVIRVYSKSIVDKKIKRKQPFMKHSFHLKFDQAAKDLREKLNIPDDENLRFDQVQKIQNDILNEFRIIVTTCGTASNARLLVSRNFSRVLMDEATMIKELDLFVPTKSALQVVLIGDQKQLGPCYDYTFKGPMSLFNRLIDLGYES